MSITPKRLPLYVYREGPYWMSSGASEEEVHAPENVIVEFLLLAPDGREVNGFPMAGGTWGGRCGASFWVDDPEYHINFVQESCIDFRTIQIQHRHRVLEDTKYILRGSAKDLGGFRVQCLEPYRHDGPCRAGVWTWRAKWTEAMEINIARRQGSFQRKLALS